MKQQILGEFKGLSKSITATSEEYPNEIHYNYMYKMERDSIELRAVAKMIYYTEKKEVLVINCMSAENRYSDNADLFRSVMESNAPVAFSNDTPHE